MEIAGKRFNCDTVLAALFHDIPYEKLKMLEQEYKDLNRFIHILDNYNLMDSNLKELYNNLKEDPSTEITSKQNLDFDPQAFAIRIAVEKDNLQTTTNECQLNNMIEFTRNILLPILEKVKAFKDADELSELCLKVEQPVVYQNIKFHLERYRQSQKDTIKYTLIRLKHIFDPNNKALLENFNKNDSKNKEIFASLENYQKNIKEFRYDIRKIYSIYRNLEATHNLECIQSLVGNNNSIPLLNCTIILKDFKIAESQRKLYYADLFFTYYKNILCNYHIYVLDYGLTTHKDAAFFTICDEMNNKYRIFIKSETEYSQYIYGNILENHTVDFLPEKYEHNITIYKKDGTSETIIAGATVLDLAFKIHGDLGLHFDYAMRNNKSFHEGPYTILSKGDIVEIKQTNHITADLNWFKYIKTDIAKYHLTRYFKTEYNRLKKQKKIKITAKDGTIHEFNQEITALDFAFSIHQDIGLHFAYALIDGKKNHMPPYTTLNDGNTVIISKNENVEPTLHWFQYVKTDLGTKYLIKYFTKQHELYKSNDYIEILDKDKRVLLIEKGATVLDFAFIIDPHLGQCFDYALINDVKVYKPNTVLNHKDNVVIYPSSKHTLKKDWINYLKTNTAKGEFSKYMKIGSSFL